MLYRVIYIRGHLFSDRASCAPQTGGETSRLRLGESTALYRAASWCSAALPSSHTLIEPAPHKTWAQKPQLSAGGACFPIALACHLYG